MSAEIWIALITSVCSLLGVIITSVIGNKKQAKHTENVEKALEKRIEGEKCLLRNEMLKTYYKHLETKQIRQYEFENFIKLYEAYVALGGNSFIFEVHEEVMKWKIVS